MTVTKRNGEVVPRDLEKYHKMIEWIAGDLPGVSVSEIEMSSNIQFIDGIKTSDMHKITTKATADLITTRNHNYQYAAARSFLLEIRKDVFGEFEPWPLLKTVKQNISKGYYEDILSFYTEEEINVLDTKINHNRDFDFTYSGLRTMYDSYTIKESGKPIESPQQINMLVPMIIFKNEKQDRLKQVISYYHDLSTFKISLPSPQYSGLRTKVKG